MTVALKNASLASQAVAQPAALRDVVRRSLVPEHRQEAVSNPALSNQKVAADDSVLASLARAARASMSLTSR